MQMTWKLVIIAPDGTEDPVRTFTVYNEAVIGKANIERTWRSFGDGREKKYKAELREVP